MTGPAVRIEAPASLPVTIEELRDYCRVEGDKEDRLLRRLASSAVAQLDGYSGKLGRAIINSRWRQEFGAFPHPRGPKLRLKLPDVSSATLIVIDDEGADHVLPADRSIVHHDVIGWFVLPTVGRNWPVGRGAVEYTAGYGEAPDDVNDAVREAICMMVHGAYRMMATDVNLRTETVEGISSQGFFGPDVLQGATSSYVNSLIARARWRPA